MKYIYLFLFIFIVIGAYIIFFRLGEKEKFENYDYIILNLNGEQLKLYIADDNKKRIKWLWGTKNINDNEWMLFVFESEDKYWFWMKNMKFDIDIIWINKDWKIVWISPRISKETYPKVYYPPRKIKYVIEILSWSYKKFNLYTWSYLNFLRNYSIQ